MIFVLAMQCLIFKVLHLRLYAFFFIPWIHEMLPKKYIGLALHGIWVQVENSSIKHSCLTNILEWYILLHKVFFHLLHVGRLDTDMYFSSRIYFMYVVRLPQVKLEENSILKHLTKLFLYTFCLNDVYCRLLPQYTPGIVWRMSMTPVLISCSQ